jgi:regulatory protein
LSTKRTSPEEALEKLQRYCAYQDRCHQEVRSKLLRMGICGDDLEAVMTALIAENFLNEERFARSFARGKFRMKQWGRERIVRELEKKSVSKYCIRQALREIPEEDYGRTLQEVLEKKLRALREPDPFKQRGLVAAHAIRKGFEPELVWEALEDVLSGQE